MPDHALELSFAPAGEAAVIAQWQALREAGIPSQADHRSMTNAPHLTLVAASPVPPATRDLARELVLPLLPVTLVVRGLVMLGQGPRVTLAHLVEPPVAVAEATARLRGSVPELRHPVWTPHITLARRVPRRHLPSALGILAEHPLTSVTADRLRWWDPDLDLVETVTAAEPSPGIGHP